MKVNLFGKTYNEIREIAEELMLPRYAADQICNWLYNKNALTIDEMSNLPKKARSMLGNKYEILRIKPLEVKISADGTKKYLFRTTHSRYIETAYIPEIKRHTLCISSQVGCKRGCSFCMTGKQGYQGDLSPMEILSQFTGIQERNSISNIVFMGMGEPLDNLDELMKSLEIFTFPYGYGMSPSRITVSTIGIIPAMKDFIEKSRCNLAVSLHSPFNEERKKLMPVEVTYPVKEVIDVLKSYDYGKQRRLSFEYIMFRGVNDTPKHVNEISRLLSGLKCRINLIRFHPVPATSLEPSDEETIIRFRNSLTSKGIITTIRASRGLDIQAACGLLSTRRLNMEKSITSLN